MTRRTSICLATILVVATAGCSHGTSIPVAAPTTTPAPAPTTTGRPATTPPHSPTASASPTPHLLYPLPAAAAFPQPCPPPYHSPPPPRPTEPTPRVPESAVPGPVAVSPHRPDLAPARGKGMWVVTWSDTHLDVPAVIAKARAAGLTSLWVRTGGTVQGWYADHALAGLLPAAHAAGLKVVAWDFPTLSDPVADAARLIRTLRYTVHGQRVDGVSPDIESPPEGVFLTAKRIRAYLSRIRAAAGARLVVATVPRPTDRRLGYYPYAAEAPYIDVFAPMVYWSCNEPGAVTREAVTRLLKWRPVHVVGQSYDMGPEGGRPGLPSAREIWRFLDVAGRSGAIGSSLYALHTSTSVQWRALGAFPWHL